MSLETIVLCLNSGSSSLKFALFRISEAAEARLASGAIENLGPKARLWVRDAQDKFLQDRQANLPDASTCIPAMFDALDHSGLPRSQAAGHRVVHGGPHYTAPQKINQDLQEELKKLVPLAPLHIPGQVALIEAITRHYPDLPQVACFDTAFHAGMPEVARRFPLPREFFDQGIRRYGFHGLSYEYIVQSLGREAMGRIIIAHLGNGASMVALRDGNPVDTSMGLTPAGGFMMSTRSGDLDPGVMLYLLRVGYTSEQLQKMIDHQSGLLGVSGCSSDMKALLEKRATEPATAQAVEMFCYGVRKFIGAYAAVLGGLDCLVFTGGMGEHAAAVRQEICRGLEFLGVKLVPERNQQHASVISASNSTCTVRVVPTDEDLMIARHTWKLVSG